MERVGVEVRAPGPDLVAELLDRVIHVAPAENGHVDPLESVDLDRDGRVAVLVARDRADHAFLDRLPALGLEVKQGARVDLDFDGDGHLGRSITPGSGVRFPAKCRTTRITWSGAGPACSGWARCCI